MRVLFINDHPAIFESLQMIFKDRDDIGMVECHSLAEAQMALAKHRPRLLFLDHELTRGGDEGFGLLYWVRCYLPETVVYTTTYNTQALEEYQRLGVPFADLANPEYLQALIEKEDDGPSDTASRA